MNPTQRQTIRQTLLELAQRELQLTKELKDTALSTQLDSMQRLSLVVAIEDHFKICFEPEDEEEIETISQVVDLILRKLAESESNSESPT